MTSGGDTGAKTLIKTLIFTIFVPGSVTVLVPSLMLSPDARPSLLPGLVGLFPITLGAMMLLVCCWDFAAKGGGAPAPVDAPRQLVMQRLYQHVRNPMFAGVLLVLAGESILFRSSRLAIYLAARGSGFICSSSSTKNQPCAGSSAIPT